MKFGSAEEIAEFLADERKERSRSRAREGQVNIRGAVRIVSEAVRGVPEGVADSEFPSGTLVPSVDSKYLVRTSAL